MIARIVKIFSYAAIGMLFVLMLFLSSDVIMRYVLNKPIRGSYELTELGLAFAVLLGLSYTTLMKGHIAIVLLTSRFPAKVQTVLSVLNSLVGVGVFGLIAWQGLDAALYARTWELTTDILRIPIFPFKLLVTIGSVLVCLVLISNIISLRQKRKNLNVTP